MVRGNWQKRVETAEARRKSAKERKQMSEDHRQYKTWAQTVMGMLDRNRDCLKHRRINIWTDITPIYNGGVREIQEDSKEINEKRSIRNGRGRSDSNADSTVKKKVHPRSKEACTERKIESPMYMCRSFFFSGKCPERQGKGKKGKCPYFHGEEEQTLFHVVGKHSHQELQKSEGVIPEYIEPEHTGAMEMASLQTLNLDNAGSSCELETTSISSYIVKCLATRNAKLANIVYVALDGKLVYDRYRNGLLYDCEKDILGVILGEKKMACEETKECETQHDTDLFQHLPGIILVNVLTFLSDETVAVVTRVCTSWHYEIDSNAPNLWKYLLDRRCWPHPCNIDTSVNDDRTLCQAYKDQFFRHYSVLRDMMAVQCGLHAICCRRGKVVEKEMVYEVFSNRKSAPASTNKCVDIFEWSPNRLLVGYQEDCSLRLFEAFPKLGQFEGKGCRELLRLNVDPYQNTKRKNCQMLAMGLDEEWICCLLTVETERSNQSPDVLIVMIRRDEFLSGENAKTTTQAFLDPDFSSNWFVFDVCEKILDYQLSSDSADQRLVDFLSHVGHRKQIDIAVSHAIGTCGYGRFMIEVSLSIPEGYVHDEGLLLIGRYLCLISAPTGEIVWAGDSIHSSESLIARNKKMMFTSLMQPRHGASRNECILASGLQSSLLVTLRKVTVTGIVHSLDVFDGSISQTESMPIVPDDFRPMVVTPTHVIITYGKVVPLETNEGLQKVVVSFHSHQQVPFFVY
jgi:hypothetical protein